MVVYSNSCIGKNVMYKCNVEKVLSGQMNNIIVSFHSFYTDCMYVALANLLSEIIMVRGSSFIIAYMVITWFYRCRYIQCLCLGLELSFTVFIVFTVCLSVMYFVYDFIINNNNDNNSKRHQNACRGVRRCRLDYCNSLLCGISDGLLRRLQTVQNAAVRLVTGVLRRDHATPLLRQFHWVPVLQRDNFKVAGLVHQSLTAMAPPHLADDCRLLSDVGRRTLRSTLSHIASCK